MWTTFLIITVSYVKGRTSEIEAAEEALGLGPQSWPGESGPGQESCGYAYLSHPQAPGRPAPHASSLGLKLSAQIQAPLGGWGFLLSPKANLSGFWQLAAPDSMSRGWGG